MKILGIEGMTGSQVEAELARGGKFVYYTYCISIIFMTFRRSSDIHFIRAGESALTPGLGWTALSLVMGWWGIPWGPIYTIGALFTNLGGGKDVTREVMNSLVQPQAIPMAA